MIKKILCFFLFLNFFNYSYASVENKIINNFKKIDNISFNFKQIINDEIEEGNCIIQYPKKIYCNYDNVKKKINCIKWKFFSNKKSSWKRIFYISIRSNSFRINFR